MFNTDIYEHFDASITYIIENELQDNDQTTDFNLLEKEFEAQILKSCKCSEGDCTTEKCHHGSNYIWNEKYKEIVLNPNRRSKDVIYECNSLCECSFDCRNRLVVFGPRKDLEITSMGGKGKGLITRKFIPRGAFICEYAGELLTKNEALKRNKINDDHGHMNYIVCLNELSDSKSKTDGLQTFIDPSKRGNIGRYLNHSCDPNCTVVSVRIDSPIPKLAFFALKDMAAGEELTFHYGGGSTNTENSLKTTECLCQSTNCAGILPNWNY
uniref:CSON003567 protein n=1 Tax=Culicoides sonorensis TaxID=179676 RepID=A0A336LCY3_CULSO